MGKIIKYGIVALLVYFAYTEWPTLLESIDDFGSDLSRTSSSVGQGRCIPAAEAASDAFSRGLRDFSDPPIDMDAWDRFREVVKGKRYDAEAACNCARDSCQRATEALSELASLVADFDNSLRGEGVPLNPSRQQETINRFLKRARDLDRQGN